MVYIVLITGYANRIPPISGLISDAIREEGIDVVPVMSKEGDVVHRWHEGVDPAKTAHVDEFVGRNGLDGILVLESPEPTYLLNKVTLLVEHVLTDQNPNKFHQDCSYCGFLTMTSVDDDVWYDDENLGKVWVIRFDTESG
jgi:hypothetical protein